MADEPDTLQEWSTYFAFKSNPAGLPALFHMEQSDDAAEWSVMPWGVHATARYVRVVISPRPAKVVGG